MQGCSQNFFIERWKCGIMFNAVHPNFKNLALSLALHVEVWNSNLTAASKVFTQLQLVVVGMATCGGVFVIAVT